MTPSTDHHRPAILLVDDHEIVREGVTRVIQSRFQEYDIKGVSSCAEAIEAVQNSELALVITDLSMSGRSGTELIAEIAALKPGLPVLVHSMHGAKDHGLRAVREGAWGYVQKSDGIEVLVTAVRQVLAGKRFVGTDLAQSLLSYVRRDADRPPHDQLSGREFQILRKLVAGLSIKEIAGEFFLSVKTVSTYRARIFTKLSVNSIAELVRYALDHGID